MILWTVHIVSEKWPLRVSSVEALLHCRIIQATVTDAFLDERKLLNPPCRAVAHVRGETNLAFKTKRPDGVACIADMLACMQIQMSLSEQTFPRKPLPHNRVCERGG